MLLSRNFCQKSVGVNFRNYHSVAILANISWNQQKWSAGECELTENHTMSWFHEIFIFHIVKHIIIINLISTDQYIFGLHLCRVGALLPNKMVNFHGKTSFWQKIGPFWLVFWVKNLVFSQFFLDFSVPHFSQEISRSLISRFSISRREMCISSRHYCIHFAKKTVPFFCSI